MSKQAWRKCKSCGEDVHINFRCHCGGNPWKIKDPQDIKPCPFCGAIPMEREPNENGKTWVIYCKHDCYLAADFRIIYEESNWNKRTIPTKPIANTPINIGNKNIIKKCE